MELFTLCGVKEERPLHNHVLSFSERDLMIECFQLLQEIKGLPHNIVLFQFRTTYPSIILSL